MNAAEIKHAAVNKLSEIVGFEHRAAFDRLPLKTLTAILEKTSPKVIPTPSYT